MKHGNPKNPSRYVFEAIRRQRMDLALCPECGGERSGDPFKHFRGCSMRANTDKEN